MHAYNVQWFGDNRCENLFDVLLGSSWSAEAERIVNETNLFGMDSQKKPIRKEKTTG